MNLNSIKTFDYKGFLLKHGEKGVGGLAALLLVGFVYSGINTSFSGPSDDELSPDLLTGLASRLQTNINNSKFTDAEAKSNNIINPNFADDVDRLQKPVDSGSFSWQQHFFHFEDFGAILRGEPEIYTPEKIRLWADRGSAWVYERDANGSFIEIDLAELRAQEKKKEELRKKREERERKRQEKRGGGGSREDSLMGGDSDSDMYGGGGGMDMQGMGGYGSDAMQMMGGDEGTGYGDGDDGGMGMGMGGGGGGGYAPGRTRQKKGGNRRTSRGFLNIDEENADQETDDGKSKKPKLVKKEVAKGLRWVAITALYPHGDQLREYAEKLHSELEHPEYAWVAVNRRELNEDGSFTDWKQIDIKALEKVIQSIPAWEEEDPDLEKALYDKLVMKLPLLAAGSWVAHSVDRLEALKAQITATGAGRSQTANASGEMADGGDYEQMNQGGDASADYGAQLGGVMGGDYGNDSMAGGDDATGYGGGGGGGMGMGGQGGGASASTGSSLGGSSRRKTKTGPQTKAGVVQIRFIDYTVEAGKTYQYRLQVGVKNPNYKRVDVADEKFKEKEHLIGDWSEDSPVVFVPHDTEYYLVQRNRRGDAKIEVHKWFEEYGDWQVSDFMQKPGDLIGKQRNHEWVDFEDELKKGNIDFSTSKMLVDITGGTRQFNFEGSTFQDSIPPEVFVMDSFGDLEVHNQSVDENDENRAERLDEISQLLADVKGTGSKRRGNKDDTEDGDSEDFEGSYNRNPSRRD